MNLNPIIKTKKLPMIFILDSKKIITKVLDYIFYTLLWYVDLSLNMKIDNLISKDDLIYVL